MKIIDNFFDEPDMVRQHALSHVAYSPLPQENWVGYRSHNHILNDTCYCFHWGPLFAQTIRGGLYNQNKYHVDNSLGDATVLAAGVIYLTPHPPPNTGTSFVINGKIHHIDNVYNRFIMYSPDILHAPHNFFGSTKEDSRLTVTLFNYGTI